MKEENKLNLGGVIKRKIMEVYEIKVEEYHNNEESLGLFSNVKDAINKAYEYRTDMIRCDDRTDSYKEVFNDHHLMEWLAIGKNANHGITIDRRNVL